MLFPDFGTDHKTSVRRIIIKGVFWRILIIESILLLGSLAYAGVFENREPLALFWYGVRIILLVGIIICFMTVTLQSFLKQKIIIPLEAIAAANKHFKEKQLSSDDLGLGTDLPKELMEIVSTRREMLQTILTVSEERLHLIDFIRKTFGRYLSAKVVDEILASPEGRKIGGRMEMVTVLMSDLRGFTAMSETTDPGDMMTVLNRYLETMSQVILAHDGMIDEFIGDAILTVFGVPERREDDPARAVACAISMQNRLSLLNRDLVREGYPPLEMGIGINTGPAIVGNIGSEIRTKYGIVGQTINIASRIESNTVGGEVLIGESTLERVKGLVRVDPPRTVMMKGITKPLVLYSVTGIGEPWAVGLPPREMQEGAAISLFFSCWRLEKKRVVGTAMTGETVRIGNSVIIARIDPFQDPQTVLKLAFEFCVDAHCFGDIYVRVLDYEEGQDTGLNRLQITSMAEKDKSILHQWIAGVS